MSETFLISDTHFSHRGIVQFLRPDGVTKERPWNNIEEMDEALVANWNSVVRPQDTVYHLGDVVINRSALPILARLNGTKILVKGNHDVFRLDEYAPYFKDIRGSAKLNDYLLTHIPVHPASIERWKGNIHGHLHSGRVYKTKLTTINPGERGGYLGYVAIPDPAYLCVSVEHTNYTPITLNEVMKRFEEQQ
jgi:calcineurin-like phosphoesterase family protein